MNQDVWESLRPTTRSQDVPKCQSIQKQRLTVLTKAKTYYLFWNNMDKITQKSTLQLHFNEGPHLLRFARLVMLIKRPCNGLGIIVRIGSIFLLRTMVLLIAFG